MVTTFAVIIGLALIVSVGLTAIGAIYDWLQVKFKDLPFMLSIFLTVCLGGVIYEYLKAFYSMS